MNYNIIIFIKFALTLDLPLCNFFLLIIPAQHILEKITGEVKYLVF